MDITTGQMIVWAITGGLAGFMVGILIKRDRKGFGLLGNLVIGMIGAIVGGTLFNLLGVDLGLEEFIFTFTLEDLIAAFVGALILYVIVDYMRRR